jgi:CRP/FNR family transcriptional regulator
MLADGVLYSIPADILRAHYRESPGAWESFAAFVAGRRRLLERKLDLLFLRDVEQRILRTLTDLAPMYASNGDGCTIQLSQSEIANLIGATRETTSTTLNAMARRGIISLGRRIVNIPSLEALAAALNRPRLAEESIGAMAAGQ